MPRLVRRADVILIVEHVLFVLEHEVGESHFTPTALDQVWDYALDLKHFHESSHNACIVPVLIATNGAPQHVELQRTIHDDGLVRPVRSNSDNLSEIIAIALSFFNAP